LSENKVRSVAVPPLGCGLGGLNWSDVRPLIEEAFSALPDLDVRLFEPAGTPSADLMIHGTAQPKMTPGRAALVGLMARYIGGLMDVSISLLEIHKLLYLMQAAGEPLRLNYKKAPYGPYAENLRHVLIAIEGHYIIGYGAGEDSPEKQIELMDNAIQPSERFLAGHSDTNSRFDRVSRLIAGYETPFGMELLSSVHWVGTQEAARDQIEACERTYAWNDRKRMFSPEQIQIAWDTLAGQEWL